MAKARTGIRFLKSILSTNIEYSTWQNKFFQLPKRTSACSQWYHHRNTSEQSKENKNKVANPNKYKKRVPIIIDANTKLIDIIRKCQLGENIVTYALERINWDVNPYESILYKDKRMIYQFLKELHIPFTIASTKPKKEKKQVKYVRPPPNESTLIQRPPIITVMGHVDHGKTTLLDTLRKTSVAQSEEGGITQRIGVFNVKLGNHINATVLDTPGHVAFNSMRERGALVTDIIIMVVAADDGVMEQTEDTIRLAKETNTPIIVAVNKIDKPNADIQMTHQTLAERGVQVEQLNGDVQCIPISALKGTNLDKLIEAIELETSLLDPKGDPTGLVEGFIIESSLDPKFGKVATILVQRGTLKNGAILITGETMTKVRFMANYLGKPVTTVGLSEAVQISGWKELPKAGETVLEVESLKMAKQLSKYQKQQKQQKQQNESLVEIAKDEPEVDEKIEQEVVEDNKDRQYSIILKTDSAGSMEAVMQLLNTYNEHEKCKLTVVHAGVGDVNPNDITLAQTFNATIYCFNTRVPGNVKQLVEQDNINLYSSNVIYTLVDNIKNELVKKYPFIDVEEITGQGNVAKLFKYHEKKVEVTIAGCLCTKGTIYHKGMYHIQRNGTTIDTGEIISLKYLKDDVTEVKKGFEFGVKLSNNELILEPGDTIVCFKKSKKMAESFWNPGGQTN